MIFLLGDSGNFIHEKERNVIKRLFLEDSLKDLEGNLDL